MLKAQLKPALESDGLGGEIGSAVPVVGEAAGAGATAASGDSSEDL
jgi:hypothetical protein